MQKRSFREKGCVFLSKRDLKLKVEEFSSAIGTFKGLQIEVGRIYEEDWEEQLGPTPFPSVATLRNWDLKLLKRYKPFYMPFCDLCCLCTFGKCDLTGDKRGAYSLTMAAQQSSARAHHDLLEARHLLRFQLAGKDEAAGTDFLHKPAVSRTFNAHSNIYNNYLI